MPVLLELFCGTKSIGRVFDQHGWDVISVDLLPRFEPTICKNVLDLTVEDIIAKLPKYRQTIDVIWASPICTQYSISRNKGPPRDLIGSDKLVQKVLDLVAYFKVPFFMENPQTGLLKGRDVVRGIPFRTIDYCQYADDTFSGRYRKRTAIWTNTNWMPKRALCNPKTCHFCSDGKKHDHSSEDRCSQSGQKRSRQKQLYKIPPALVEEFLGSVPYCVHSKPHLLHVTKRKDHD